MRTRLCSADEYATLDESLNRHRWLRQIRELIRGHRVPEVGEDAEAELQLKCTEGASGKYVV